ncbi:MAG: formate dehydrogenase accessory protein FdhE [Thermodesulfovibrionales bacterium]
MNLEGKTGLDNPGDAEDPAEDPIVQRLRTVVKDNADLREAAQVYEVILPALRDAAITIRPVLMTSEQARAKLEKGVPLLQAVSLEIDDQEVCGLMMRLASALEKSAGQNKIRADAAGRIRLTLEEGRLDVSSLLPDIAAGASEGIFSAAQSLDLDPGMLRTLLSNAMEPFLRQWCRQLAPLAEGAPWDRGQCPVCGAAATLAELQGNNQGKHLRCGSCGADWTFRRLQCLYCGNEDHNTLGLLYTEDQTDRMRVEVCDRCHGYLKVITAFAPTPAEMLPVEDLATLHLDYIAQGHGYSRVEKW